jgi:hypothetical protein
MQHSTVRINETSMTGISSKQWNSTRTIKKILLVITALCINFYLIILSDINSMELTDHSYSINNVLFWSNEDKQHYVIKLLKG